VQQQQQQLRQQQLQAKLIAQQHALAISNSSSGIFQVPGSFGSQVAAPDMKMMGSLSALTERGVPRTTATPTSNGEVNNTQAQLQQLQAQMQLQQIAQAQAQAQLQAQLQAQMQMQMHLQSQTQPRLQLQGQQQFQAPLGIGGGIGVSAAGGLAANACFSCGEEGHLSRNCPHRGTARAPAGLANKPCAFFQTRAGCRNGSRCPYLHDPSYKAPQEEFNRISAPAVRRP